MHHQDPKIKLFHSLLWPSTQPHPSLLVPYPGNTLKQIYFLCSHLPLSFLTVLSPKEVFLKCLGDGTFGQFPTHSSTQTPSHPALEQVLVHEVAKESCRLCPHQANQSLFQTGNESIKSSRHNFKGEEARNKVLLI